VASLICFALKILIAHIISEYNTLSIIREPFFLRLYPSFIAALHSFKFLFNNILRYNFIITLINLTKLQSTRLLIRALKSLKFLEI
jgi:hypothetical protein